MERDDVQLIDAVLSGDDSAFTILVEKYQKSIHALVWHKIDDFHYAEEITQDTFLRAYQKLSTLRNKSQFLNWLYVIADRLCLNWLRKQKPTKQLQSLEDTPMEEVAKSDYARYESEQRETEATEHRFEIVKKLLDKLPESERSVIVLYYLGELTTKDIGKFLGTSVETIRTRMHRARKRLREEEELLIQEVLGGVQISTTIKQNIMRRVVDMKPTPSLKMDRFLPWTAIAATLVLSILLIYNVSTQYLGNMQKEDSINFADQSEDTRDEVSFEADFTITVGTHSSGTELLNALIEKKCCVSIWSMQALNHPSFQVVSEEMTLDIVVISMFDLGFVKGEFATLSAIYKRAKQMGLELCPIETAAQLRLQFLDQPDWSTGDRLGEFFVGSEPFFLTREGLPKIFSVVRDDNFPYADTGIGLWLISNGTVGGGDWQDSGRLFNASDPDGVDHGGRFAFVIPK